MTQTEKKSKPVQSSVNPGANPLYLYKNEPLKIICTYSLYMQLCHLSMWFEPLYLSVI
jgi:hypothetical protein